MTLTDAQRAGHCLGKRQGKYGAKRTANRLTGRTHDSKAEALYGEELEYLRRAGEITELEQQPVVDLAGLTYRADFSYVERGQRVWIDVKGAVKQRDRDVLRLWKQNGPGELRIVKRKGRSFEVVRVVMPERKEPAS